MGFKNDRQNNSHPDAVARKASSQVARLAHEIKNAMTSVSTFLQQLSSKWDDAQFRASFYPIARDEAERVNFLLNEMLDLGKSQSGQLVPTDIQELVVNLIALKAPLAQVRQQEFQTHFNLESAVVRIDADGIEEALGNILNNALEATPDGGHIDIRLASRKLPGGRPAVLCEIRDSGPGIDQEKQDEIFMPYMTTKPANSLKGGTGLGLDIARRHVQAHGGTIEVESLIGKGALFRVILPVERRRG